MVCMKACHNAGLLLVVVRVEERSADAVAIAARMTSVLMVASGVPALQDLRRRLTRDPFVGYHWLLRHVVDFLRIGVANARHCT